jgi:hypothetical protein
MADPRANGKWHTSHLLAPENSVAFANAATAVRHTNIVAFANAATSVRHTNVVAFANAAASVRLTNVVAFANAATAVRHTNVVAFANAATSVQHTNVVAFANAATSLRLTNVVGAAVVSRRGATAPPCPMPFTFDAAETSEKSHNSILFPSLLRFRGWGGGGGWGVPVNENVSCVWKKVLPKPFVSLQRRCRF